MYCVIILIHSCSDESSGWGHQVASDLMNSSMLYNPLIFPQIVYLSHYTAAKIEYRIICIRDSRAFQLQLDLFYLLAQPFTHSLYTLYPVKGCKGTKVYSSFHRPWTWTLTLTSKRNFSRCLSLWEKGMHFVWGNTQTNGTERPQSRFRTSRN